MSRFTAMLLVALSLGLGWAIRGHFGHEWGACWAGTIGALAVLVAARRPDWSRRMPTLAALGGIGWATGGMMSYGILVGQGRADAGPTVAYGLSMLLVVGGLYGAIGGGLLGLGLETTDDHRPDWAGLITQMVAGAILAWGILIYQFEWYMTPPRSELWAACLGAAAAMLWFLQRNGYLRAFRVACYAALGAGFGFAFGDFLQMLGDVSGLSFNWWNVMEFTLGFCGGLGMAYAVFSRTWPTCAAPSRRANYVSFIFLLFAVPATNILHAFEVPKLINMATQYGRPDPAGFALTQLVMAWSLVALFLVAGLVGWRWAAARNASRPHAAVAMFLLGYTMLYLFFSHLIKGVFYQPFMQQLEQKLYWLCFLAMAVLAVVRLSSRTSAFTHADRRETNRRWITLGTCLVLAIALMTWATVRLKATVP